SEAELDPDLRAGGRRSHPGHEHEAAREEEGSVYVLHFRVLLFLRPKEFARDGPVARESPRRAFAHEMVQTVRILTTRSVLSSSGSSRSVCARHAASTRSEASRAETPPHSARSDSRRAN